MPFHPISLRGPAILASALVMPFVILELVNGGGLSQSFPIPLFVVMWLLPFAFFLILRPTLQLLRPFRAGLSSYMTFVGPVCLILIAWFWIVLVHDQMPCFLGVPNCD